MQGCKADATLGSLHTHLEGHNIHKTSQIKPPSLESTNPPVSPSSTESLSNLAGVIPPYEDAEIANFTINETDSELPFTDESDLQLNTLILCAHHVLQHQPAYLQAHLKIWKVYLVIPMKY